MIEIIAIMAAELCYQAPNVYACEKTFESCVLTSTARTEEEVIEECTKEVSSFLRMGETKDGSSGDVGQKRRIVL